MGRLRIAWMTLMLAGLGACAPCEEMAARDAVRGVWRATTIATAGEWTTAQADRVDLTRDGEFEFIRNVSVTGARGQCTAALVFRGRACVGATTVVFAPATGDGSRRVGAGCAAGAPMPTWTGQSFTSTPWESSYALSGSMLISPLPNEPQQSFTRE